MAMMRFVVTLVFILGISIAEGHSGRCPDVHPPTGKIRGSIINSRLGKPIYSYRGVRYAEPPVGQQRFQPPIPAKAWDDVFDASEEGPGCPRIGNQTKISEDCLRLNVYTTKLPSKGETVKRPVMVFFHPGAFYLFSGQSFFFGPEYIMDKDIVLVTVNYRLGTLGFISTGDSLAPGNLGMKDQVAALRWVQRNIEAFGGDPNSVTISGYSVGSISVVLHMLSPMSRNLFHRAIAMSGGVISLQPLPTEQKELAKRQAQLLGCPTDTTGAMLVCLNSKPVESFNETMNRFFEYYGDPMLIWSVVVEPEVHGVERFLTDQPADLIRRGEFYQVPLITGVVEEEFGPILAAVKNLTRENKFSFDSVNNNWTATAPISFMYERGTPKSREISLELKRFYFGDQPISPTNLDGFAYIYTDSVVIYPVYRSARLLAEHSRAPVYFYKFTFKGRYSFAYWNATTPYGVVHHDDLQYLFFMEAIFPFFESNAPEIPMVERYTSMWTNFVQTGEPIPKDNDMFRGLTWERFVPAKDNYLEINLNPTMKTGFFPERMREFDKLFPLPPLNAPSNVKH